MTAHTKVTTIAHTAAGMGQVWYRVTGGTGVANVQVAYRVGVGDSASRRVRMVGAGGTAELIGFRPGQLLTDPHDFLRIELAFSGRYLTHGVKTQRSKLARLPARPIQAVIAAALARQGFDAKAVFASRDAGNHWRAVARAGERDRSVSFLTAAGVLRACDRAGVDVLNSELMRALGGAARLRLAEVSPRRVPVDAIEQLSLDALELESLGDDELGVRLWKSASESVARKETVGNAGYELTLTLPKSFSLYALSGDPRLSGEWLDVLEVAATRALEQLMAEAGFCSTGHRGDGQEITIMAADGWAGFIATEISSRAGDPHLHVHCTLPNVLVGVDGIVRTMADGGRELHVNAPRFAAWGQEFFIAEAQARGLLGEIWFDPATAQWEVGGFGADSLAAFSRGRQAVLAEADLVDDGRPVTARTRASRNRAAKSRATSAKSSDQPTWIKLRDRNLERALDMGLDLAAERDSVVERFRSPSAWTDEEWVDWVGFMACQHESVSSLAKIRSIVDLATLGMPVVERRRIAKLVVNGGFVRAEGLADRGMRSGGQLWVSRAALRAESQLLDHMRASVDIEVGRSHRTTSAIARFETDRGWELSDEQRRAVSAIVDGKAPITLISGVGGSGKTSVLAAAQRGLENERYGLLVTSTATKAASAAGHESGAQWMNLTALVHRINSGQPLRAHVIVVDEASMADVATLSRIADYCVQTGRRLVLQGDHAQLRAVGAGDAFNVLCAEHPDAVFRLETNQRQRTEEGRALAAALHSRDLESAWGHLSDEGTVLVARSHEHKLELVAQTVVRHITSVGAENVTCDAVTNAEVDELNERIHAQLLAEGALDASTAVTFRGYGGDRMLAPGTILRVTTPLSNRDPGRRLVRGDRAVVTSVGRDKVGILLDGGSARSIVPRTVLRHFDYGYAGTTHKVQGHTSEVHIASLAPTKDVASLYVSATRARERTIFVADARDYLSANEMREASTWKQTDLDDEVLERVKKVLAGKSERIDSPRQAAHQSLGTHRPTFDHRPGGMGIAM